MAVRKISTELIVTGEKEYRAAMQNINREMKTMQSALKLVDSNFKGQANSLDALNAKNKALNDILTKVTQKYQEETKALQKASALRDQYADAAQSAQKRLDELSRATADSEEEQSSLDQQIQKTQAELSRYQEATEKAAAAMQNHSAKANAAQVQINDLNREISENKQYLSEAAISANGCARSIDEYGRKTQTAAEQSEEFGDKSKNAVNQLAQALIAAGLTRSLKEIAQVLQECSKASIEFESAMAGVAKTTDLSPSELDDMAKSLLDLSTQMPMAASELAGITEAAGQLGIAKENLVAFTAVMANLGVATNLSAEEAATSLAKFSNIVKMDPENYERLGSVVVGLGNNFATTEADIVAMATRLASAGKLAGLTEPEIMALAAAMSSVGIEAEAGGTAMTQTLAAIEKAVIAGGEDIEQFARVADMSAAEFAQTWKNEPVQALSAFIAGLGELDEQGESATIVLDGMGLTGIRQSNMLKSLALSAGNMTQAIELANREWLENTALAKEAGTRYATTESKIQMFQNSVQNLKTVIGDDLNPALRNMTDTGTDVVKWATDYVEANGWLVPSIAAVTASAGVAGLAISGLALTTIPQLTAALATLGTVITTHPVFMIGTAIAAVTVGFATFMATVETTSDKVAQLTEKAAGLETVFAESESTYQDTASQVSATASVVEGYISRLKDLESQGLDTNASQLEYKQIVDQINALMPELNLTIDEQTGLLQQNAAAILTQVSAWKQEALNEAIRKKYMDQIQASADATVELAQNEAELAKATAEKDALDKQMLENQEKQTANAERLNELSTLSRELTQEEWEEVARLSEEQEGLIDQQAELGRQTTEVENQQRLYTMAVEEGTEKISALQSEIDSVTEAVAQMDGTMESAGEQADSSFGVIVEQAQKLQQEFNEAKASAYENISEVIGLFQQMDLETSKSVEDMLAALDSQAQYMDEYAANMARAVELGVDEGLIRQLADGSEESAAILRGIVEDGGAHVDELNAALKRVEEGKQNFSNEIAMMETDFANQMDLVQGRYDELVAGLDQYDEAAAAANDTVQGIIDAVGARESDVYNAFANLGAAGNRGYTEAMDQHSPSKVMYDNASMDVQGAINGLQDREKDMEKAFAETAQAGIRGYQYAMAQAANRMDQATQQAASTPVMPSQNMTLALILDGETIGEIVTPYVNGTLNASFQKAKRGRGI